MFVFAKMVKCSHPNVHNSITRFVPVIQLCFKTIKHFYSQFEVDSRITQDKYIVDRSTEKNEAFSFPLFLQRLTRNVEWSGINIPYEANILLTSCSIWD